MLAFTTDATQNNFHVETSDITVQGTFPVIIRAKLKDWTIQNETTINFTLTVTTTMDYCSYYLSWQSTPTIAQIDYKALDPAVTHTFSNYTWLPANCSSRIQYTATLANGSALPSWVTCNTTTNEIKVYSTNISLTEDIDVKVTAKLFDFAGLNETSFTFKVNATTDIDWCGYNLAWTSLPTITTQTYNAGDP